MQGRTEVAGPAVSPAAGSPELPPYAVACSGEGKGGTLSVLRRSVTPDVITEVPLPGGQGLRFSPRYAQAPSVWQPNTIPLHMACPQATAAPPAHCLACRCAAPQAC